MHRVPIPLLYDSKNHTMSHGLPSLGHPVIIFVLDSGISPLRFLGEYVLYHYPLCSGTFLTEGENPDFAQLFTLYPRAGLLTEVLWSASA